MNPISLLPSSLTGSCRRFICAMALLFSALPTVQAITVDIPADRDARILMENPELTFGNGCCISVFNDGGGNKHHALVGFDLDSLPDDAVIQSAVLHLTTADTPGGPWHQFGGQHTDVYALIQDWHGPTASWNKASVGVPWTVAGGTIDPHIYAVNSDTVFGGNHLLSWVITDLVKEWASGSRANYGLLLDGSVGDTLHFYSTATGAPNQVPSLEIQYEVPEASPPVSAALVLFALALYQRRLKASSH